jgi:hypothetical protein
MLDQIKVGRDEAGKRLDQLNDEEALELEDSLLSEFFLEDYY